MPSKYKLTFFDIRARAEMTRMVFVAANEPYGDVRIKLEDWQEFKPKTPQGQLPMLEVNGKVICQSFTIARFVARELNKLSLTRSQIHCWPQKSLMLPKCPIGRSVCEECRRDFYSEDAGPTFVGYIEKAIEQFGSNGYAVSNSLSVADVAIYTHLEFWRFKDSLDTYPKIAQVRVFKRVEENKNVAKYFKERPDREF